MNYLSQNQYKYLQSPQSIVNFTGQSIQTYKGAPFILYTQSRMPVQSITSNVQIIKFPNIPAFTDTTTFNFVNQSIPSNHNILLCNAGLAFSCSDITSIQSDDTITFTMSIGDSSVTRTYTVLPQYINMYQLYDYLKVNSSTRFTLTATSTVNLSYFPVQKVSYDPSGTYGPDNEVVCKIVLL